MLVDGKLQGRLSAGNIHLPAFQSGTYHPTFSNMTRFVALLLIMVCTSFTVEAQTYTEHLKKKEPNKQGTVMVIQSAEIDELVNGRSGIVQETKPIKNEKSIPQPSKQSASIGKTPAASVTSATKESGSKHENDSARKGETPKKDVPPHNNATKNTDDDELKIPVIDTRKKVMRGGYKVDGYRVQAFAGGNSREDKRKAQQAGDKIKAAYPDQPVYVHFYSPRWICRVGNYRSMEEASRMLTAVQALGYKQAVIVKGKITVQY